MYRRNRCLDEITESLQITLREAVHANASPAARRAAERSSHVERRRRVWLLLAAVVALAALALPLLP